MLYSNKHVSFKVIQNHVVFEQVCELKKYKIMLYSNKNVFFKVIQNHIVFDQACVL
jgi:hypothetical protein